jgi:hypothetical protein
MNRDRELVTLLEEFAIMHRDELEAGEIFTLGRASAIVDRAPRRVARIITGSTSAGLVLPADDDPLAHACPYCDAPIGENCRSSNGVDAQEPHKLRVDKNHDVEQTLSRICPTCYAGEGVVCVDPKTKSLRLSWLHPARRLAAGFARDGSR